MDAERREADSRGCGRFDVALILHADHELNASTFAARVIAGTLSDMHSAIMGAIGALKGPLHGGANEEMMKMLLEIGKTGGDPVEYVKALLAQKKKISGSGTACTAPRIRGRRT